MGTLEHWEKFLSIDEFEISDFGRVRITDTCEIVPWQYTASRNGTKRGGYAISGPRVTLAPGYTFRIPHVVLEVFCEPRPNGAFALHRNDNRLDNRYPENLYWGDAIENGADFAVNYMRRRSCCSLPDLTSPLIPFVLDIH